MPSDERYLILKEEVVLTVAMLAGLRQRDRSDENWHI
jgi:hypothetical protein